MPTSLNRFKPTGLSDSPLTQIILLKEVQWMPSCSPSLSVLPLPLCPLTLRGLKLLGRQIFVFESHGISVLPDILS